MAGQPDPPTSRREHSLRQKHKKGRPEDRPLDICIRPLSPAGAVLEAALDAQAARDVAVLLSGHQRKTIDIPTI